MVAMVNRLWQWANSLFVKILLSFWVILLLTLITALLIIQLGLNSDHRLPGWAKQELEHSDFMFRLKEFAPEFLPPPMVSEFGHPLPPLQAEFILVNKSGQIVNAVPLNGDRREILRFVLSSDDPHTPKLKVLRHQQVIFGPRLIQRGTQTYLLYIHRPISQPRFDQLSRFAMRPVILLGALIIFSLIACMALAWHIATPLKKLRNAANQIAVGDLSATLPNIHRRDEVGQLADSLSQMSHTLANAITNQQRLLSDISHELRSPLTRLNMAVALSYKRYGSTNELCRIERESGRLEEMIHALLGLSRMQLDESKIEKQDLAQLLSDLDNDCQFEASQVGKTFQLTHHGPKTLYCFPESLLSAIENLCRNAIKYAVQQIELTIIEQGNNIIITVTDDGPGIPDNELVQVFRPFYRASAARDRDSGGVGLGLAIADWAVRQHGGNIAAHNRSHHNGLCVTIRLPRRTGLAP
ncbi:ATP-binding protein [Celerinatantimonas yamalensis]|uniref:histidine kinase n=1 Tax=Celerinatantimonas yamalensis TaxID=559956 RepID=A0ABW9GA56_9GAMM